MKKNTEYKFIMLLNNDFIFTKIDLEKNITGFLKLINPLKIIFSEDDDSINYNFIPWIPFTDDNTIPLSTKSIITITSLSDELIELYETAIQNISESKLMNRKDFDISLLN